ncbi:MAG TPA: hypothetical protein VJ927_08205 [Actinomycetota bacterium]|nr:hypothetical protein [Actinomycetota bacterium]
MSTPVTGDYFEKARAVAATILFVCAATAILGSFLDWVTVEPPVVIPADQAPRAVAFNGLDAGDGVIVIGAGIVVIIGAVLLVLRARSSFAWLAFFASMVIGGIAIADFRGLDALFYDEMNRIGDPSPGIGLILVAAGGLIGLVAAVAGVAATPARPLEDES